MKATSKLISVVLILAMCLSLFTVSAFAEPGQTIIIGGPVESTVGGSGAVVGDTYMGSGFGEEETVPASGNAAAVTAPAAAASVPAGPTVVSTAEELKAAAAKGGEIQLASPITLSETLTLAADTVLDLKGNTLTFAGGAAKSVAVQSASWATVKNGALVVSGKEAQGNEAATGFESAATGVTLNNVNVTFDAPEAWSIFGTVGLVYGSYNRDVSAYVNTDTYELVNSNGRYVVQDKTAAAEPPVAEPVAPAVEEPAQTEPAAPAEPTDESTGDTQETPAAENADIVTEETEEPAGEGKQVAEETEESVAEGEQVTEETEEPAAEGEQVTEETEEPAAEGEQVTEETGEPAAEGEQVTEETEEPAAEGEQVTEETEEPAAEGEQTAEIENEEPATEGEEPATEGEEPAAEGEQTGDETVPESDEQLSEENPEGEEPADETPVDVVEEEEKTYEDEVRVSEEEEAKTDDLVTLTGTDEATGAVVTVSGKNLPEGLTVVVKPLSTDAIGELEENERALLALDISLVDADGNEYEPKDDPNVGAVSVQIQHASLGNLEEDESLTVYHVVDDVAQAVASAEQSSEDAVDFATSQFSPFYVTAKNWFLDDTVGADTAKTGSPGEVHRKNIKITNMSGDVYVKGSGGLTFRIEGGAVPESISIVDPDKVSSGNADVFKAGYLRYDTEYSITDAGGSTVDPVTEPNTDPVFVTIDDIVLDNAPTGKWAVVFWFKDTTDSGSTRVYMVQYITVVPQAEIKALAPIDAFGDFYFEKCDYNPLEIYLTAELDTLKIRDSKGKVVASYDYDKDKKHVYVNTKQFPNKKFNFGDMIDVSDYVTTDAVGHEYIAGKTLKIYESLIKKLDFGDYTISVSQKNHAKGGVTPDYTNPASATFNLTLVPGISVADGLNDYIKGKNIWIKFVACAPIDYDDDGTLAIWIGGQKISKDYYSISNDHQTLWIYRNLLDQLRSNNSYTLTARLWRLNNQGQKETYYPATTSFNILAAGSTSYKSPKTGDNSNVALWAAVLVLSGGAVVALIPKKKKIGK